jgi:16S rRNA (guanine527-N7)-methyltransferase
MALSPKGLAAGLRSLAERYGLATVQEAQLFAILRDLTEVEGAPTTVREPGQALDIHLADSLAALELESVRAATRIADLGAGAGFPGLPLAIALPSSQVWLVESQRRKCTFIEHVCRSAGIANARVVCARAETWEDGRGRNDLVLARALAPPAVVLEYAAPLLEPGGALIDWRGQRDDAAEAAAAVAASQLGLELLAIRRMKPYPAAREHHLHEYRKVAATPARFPRRPGIARKRPLGC